ncbi:TPA: ATP-binding protein [Yersinia enterocolitica]|nr:ATP-binding protein [Yersinia enterocolitica]HDL7492316.1 ATP-binding protein [Yersinia enterocolitica]
MQVNNQLIKTIKIKKLFGLYDYTLPEIGSLSNASILYGDNGVGKSTVLRLAFHLLSASNSSGHRSELYKSSFLSLEVILSSGIKLLAEFEIKRNRKILVLKILEKNNLLAIWDYYPESLHSRTFDEEVIMARSDYELFFSDGRRVLTKRGKQGIKGQDVYIGVLRKIVPTTFILNADRRLDSDSVSDPGDEVELRRKLKFKEPRDISDLLSRSREIAVSQALNRANKWISRMAVQGTNQGADNVHSVYGRVLKHLVHSGSKDNRLYTEEDKINLMNKLSDIEIKTTELAKYELATVLDTNEFKDILSSQNVTSYSLSADLLKPYIESLESRLAAVEPIYLILDKFVTIINGLLSDKKIGYHLSQGFYIQNTLGENLETSQLSSGEQQLLLLFCYVIVARDESSVFMIDEPEISLNIKWQRKLIKTLLDITEGANIQFLFASHSMELLSQHEDRVVVMVNKNER